MCVVGSHCQDGQVGAAHSYTIRHPHTFTTRMGNSQLPSGIPTHTSGCPYFRNLYKARKWATGCGSNLPSDPFLKNGGSPHTRTTYSLCYTGVTKYGICYTSVTYNVSKVLYDDYIQLVYCNVEHNHIKHINIVPNLDSNRIAIIVTIEIHYHNFIGMGTTTQFDVATVLL